MRVFYGKCPASAAEFMELSSIMFYHPILQSAGGEITVSKFPFAMIAMSARLVSIPLESPTGAPHME